MVWRDHGRNQKACAIMELRCHTTYLHQGLSWQIVPHEYINPDPLLRLDKWPVIRLGDQHADGASHFMAGVLVDDGVDAAADLGAS